MAIYRKLTENMEHMMQNNGLWHDSLLVDIPRKWEKYGDTILIDKEKYLKNAAWKQAGSEVWTTICKSLNARRVALKGRICPNGYRTPNCEVVWGDSDWVECQDNGIKYTWNITKSMFCAGNASERHRIATMNCEGEVVVDLYAGIGYFTLPYLVHAKAGLVHACEWNPHAIEALEKNLLLNNVTDKCIVHPGDNQMAGLNDVADRVNCGLLPSSRPGWQLACKSLKSSVGGILHLHENVESGVRRTLVLRDEESSSFIQNKTINLKHEDKDIVSTASCKNSVSIVSHGTIMNADVHFKKEEWKWWAVDVSHRIQGILQTVKNGNWEVKILKLNHVKSYAPHVDHLVLDLFCRPSLTT